MPTSNHYSDSLIGFVVTIFVWAFVGAAIYKSTKSTLAYAVYHAFINSIGAIYDWNAWQRLMFGVINSENSRKSLTDTEIYGTIIVKEFMDKVREYRTNKFKE